MQSPWTYPQYTGPPQAPYPSIKPRNLLPLLAPPKATAPAYPSRPALFVGPPGGWTRSVHAAPGAYPRSMKEALGANERTSTPYAVGPTPPAGEDKAARAKRQAAEATAVMRKRYDATWWDTTAQAQEGMRGHKGVWIGIERWTRDVPVGGITVVLTHANGLPKEQWAPIMHDLLTRSPTAPGRGFGTGTPLKHGTNVQIDEVWFLDDATHGTSVDLNAGLMGDVHAWLDTGRDMLNFVLHTLPTVTPGKAAPYQLEWAPEGSRDYRQRVVPVGHSFGATASIFAANARPELFEALCCVEPTCRPTGISKEAWISMGCKPQAMIQTMGAIRRRNEWPSRAVFAKESRSNPFYGKWTDAAFDIFLTHGLVPVDEKNTADERVTLATPPWLEAAVFTEPDGVARGFDAMFLIKLPIGYIMCGDKDPVWTGGAAITRELVWRPRLARNERVDGGHLLIQEKPKEVADAMWRFFTTLDAGEWATYVAKL